MRRKIRDVAEVLRNDTTGWEYGPSSADIHKGSTVVFSLRLSADELELLRDRATAWNMPVSDVIKGAVFNAANGSCCLGSTSTLSGESINGTTHSFCVGGSASFTCVSNGHSIPSDYQTNAAWTNPDTTTATSWATSIKNDATTINVLSPGQTENTMMGSWYYSSCNSYQPHQTVFQFNQLNRDSSEVKQVTQDTD